MGLIDLISVTIEELNINEMNEITGLMIGALVLGLGLIMATSGIEVLGHISAGMVVVGLLIIKMVDEWKKSEMN